MDTLQESLDTKKTKKQTKMRPSSEIKIFFLQNQITRTLIKKKGQQKQEAFIDDFGKHKWCF